MARVSRNHKIYHRYTSRHTPQRPAVSPRRKHLSSKRHSVAFSFSSPPSASRSGRTNYAGGTNGYSPNYNLANTLSDDDESIYHGSNDEEHDDSDSESSVFHWEEESTLLDDLMDQHSQPSSDESLVDLIHSLQDAFTDRGKLNKQEMAQILVPCHNEIKRTTKFVCDTADKHYGKPLIQFNAACKSTEASLLERRQALIAARDASETENEQIIGRLKDLYTQRAAVWSKLQSQLDEILEPTRDFVTDTPARIERKITEAEKETKAYEKTAFQKIRWNDLLKSS